MKEYGPLVEYECQGKSKVPGERTLPVPLHPLQIPQGQKSPKIHWTFNLLKQATPSPCKQQSNAMG
jgi:hypothetical protein